MSGYLPTFEVTEQGAWRAYVIDHDGETFDAYGPDPLVAVCRLVDGIVEQRGDEAEARARGDA